MINASINSMKSSTRSERSPGNSLRNSKLDRKISGYLDTFDSPETNHSNSSDLERENRISYKNHSEFDSVPGYDHQPPQTQVVTE